MVRVPRPVARLALSVLLAALPAARGEAADDPPKIRTLSPAYAPRGTTVDIVIEGTNLYPLDEVKCSAPGVVALVQDGSTAVKLKVRLTIAETVTAGTVQLAVKTKNGTAMTERFSVRLRAPMVSKVKPDALKRGGEYDLAITGSYFALPGIDPKLTTDAPMSVVKAAKSDDKTLYVRLTVPAATPVGTHAIAIEMPDGKVNAAFTVLLSPPTATGVKPAAVPRGGESDVKVEGTDLGGAGTVALAVPDAAINIRLGGTPEAKSVPLHLTIAGDAKPGPRRLVLTSADGVTTTTVTIALKPPAYTGLTPIGTPRGTTTDVKIAGTDLPADAPPLVVPPDAAVRVERSRTGGVRIATDANAKPGPRMLCLTTGDGAAVVPFFVTLRPPVVAGVMPAEVEPGKPVDLKIEGQFLGGCAWSVVPEDPDVTVAPGKTADRLVMTIKPSAKPGPRCLVARNDDGASIGITSVKGSSAGVPVLMSATPPRIDRPAKSAVTLSGMNLRGKGDKAPEFAILGPGGSTLAAEITESTPSAIVLSVTTDAKTVPGAYVISVKTEEGGAAISLLVGPTIPTITSAAPARVVRPATTTLTLAGAGLSNPDGSPPAVSIARADGSQPISVTQIRAAKDSVQIDLTLPPDAALGGYVVSLATTDGAVAVPFSVDGAPPALTSITPLRLGVPATQEFVVTGENLLNPDGKPGSLQVTRTGSAADMTPLLVSSDASSLTFRVTTKPGTLPGPHLISVRTADGVSAILFTVVEAAPPVVTGLDASTGNRMGTVLTILRGSGLASATEMKFAGKGVTATLLQNDNDRELHVKITAAADADLGPHAFTLTAPGGTTTSGSVVFTVK